MSAFSSSPIGAFEIMTRSNTLLLLAGVSIGNVCAPRFFETPPRVAQNLLRVKTDVFIDIIRDQSFWRIGAQYMLDTCPEVLNAFENLVVCFSPLNKLRRGRS
jgi:hypothetical protein